MQHQMKEPARCELTVVTVHGFMTIGQGQIVDLAQELAPGKTLRSELGKYAAGFTAVEVDAQSASPSRIRRTVPVVVSENQE